MRLMRRLPFYSPTKELAEAPHFRDNIGHLRLVKYDRKRRKLSLLFLQFILLDELMEQILLFVTEFASQAPPSDIANSSPDQGGNRTGGI